jgi:hypothetical protein
MLKIPKHNAISITLYSFMSFKEVERTKEGKYINRVCLINFPFYLILVLVLVLVWLCFFDTESHYTPGWPRT